MRENLLAYIENKKQRLSGLQIEFDKAVEAEHYFLASEIKGMRHEITMTIDRLQRIVDGKQAFEEPINAALDLPSNLSISPDGPDKL